jgi:hypothetical protein
MMEHNLMFAQQMRIKLIEDRTNFYTKKINENRRQKKIRNFCNAHLLLSFCISHSFSTFES